MPNAADLSTSALRAKAEALARLASPLDPDPVARQELAQHVFAHAEAYLANVATARTFVEPAPTDAAASDFAPRELGVEIQDALSLLANAVDGSGAATTSPRYVAYIPAGGLFHSALGDFLAAISNRYAGLAFTAPGAVKLENSLIAWMASVIGFPGEAVGTLTSGGSLANLTAIVAIRDASALRVEDADRAVIYLTEHRHHCVTKALDITGLAGVRRRYIGMDDGFRMRADELERGVAADLQAGFRPWLVVGAAGTTHNGAIDPLGKIADICERHGADGRKLWFHVDGAYGGLYALCPEGKTLLAGIERADTVVLDAHKTLFLPYGTGAVIARDRGNLLRSFVPKEKVSYMQNLIDGIDEISPSDLSPELTRHFRGLRLWLPLQLAGVSAFRAALSEKLVLAKYCHRRLSEIPFFQVGTAPDLSIVTFRYAPPDRDLKELNQRLEQTLRKGGELFLSGVEIDGKWMLRCAIQSFRTHLSDLDRMIDAIARAAGALG